METFDFGNGPVLAYRHRNPDGTEGGWVANTTFVAETATFPELIKVIQPRYPSPP